MDLRDLGDGMALTNSIRNVAKRTPIHSLAQRMGATFVQVDGWSVVDAFGGEEETLAQGELLLGLADRSARARVLVEGEQAATLVQRAWKIDPPDIHGGALLESGSVFRLRQDRFFLSGPPGLEPVLISVVEAARRPEDGVIVVSDATHGRAELWLLGRLAPDLLSRLCGLDFHPQAFPNLTVRESSVAKTAQLIVRRDVGSYPLYALIGARSFGAYLWQTIVEAAHDLPLRHCGERALQALRDREADAAS